MSAFEQNLWREVMREYGADLASAERPDRERRRRARPRLVVGTTAAAAAGGTALALLLSGTASPPAYAITRHRDGTVTVIAKQAPLTPGQIARFNRALANLGARTGGAEKLIPTASGVEVRCPGAHGPLVRARISTVSVRPGPAASVASQRPVTVIAWRCADLKPGTGG